MKRIYVAATEQHAGKTTISVGLYRAALERGLRTCFIKPVGQRYVMEGEEQVDEDAVLFKRALLAKGNVKDMSPVTIPRGFTREYIFDRNPEAIHRAILEAVESLEAEHDLTIVEGTGHAGVGSVIDSSNAEVARLLDAKCLIIAGGGIGRCIDELCLNRALFDRFG
ncbi:MAG: AAA family ATPase, partial [Planctomycetota bacterium]